MTNTIPISNEFFEVLLDLTNVSRKLLIAIIHDAKRQGPKETYEFHASALSEAAGISGTNNWRDINSALDSLRSTKWDRLKEDVVSDFGGVLYEPYFEKNSGLISKVILSRNIKDMIFIDHEAGHYTNLDASEIKKLKGKYAPDLYGQLMTKLYKGAKRFGFIELRNLLKAPVKYRYSHFDSFCLKGAIKEINKKCSFDVSYSPVKKGRRVTDIDFVVTKKDSGKKVVCHRTADQIDWETEMRVKHGVTISIIDKLRKKDRLDIEHMIRFWNESLKADASDLPLQWRGKYIYECYNSAHENGMRFSVAAMEYAMEGLTSRDEAVVKFPKIDLGQIPQL